MTTDVHPTHLRNTVAQAAFFRLEGTSITKVEETDVDVFKGAKDELIAAGIVQAWQWPSEGKKSISWLNGQRITRNCKKDETYRNIVLYGEVPRVSVGVPPSVRKARKVAAEASWKREREDKRKKELTEQAIRAMQCLEQVPKSEREFLLESVSSIRDMMFSVSLKRLDEEKSWHGYRFTTETKEAALMAVDAIIEALVQGEIVFDAERQGRIVAAHQAVIRAADPSFDRHIKALVTPNATILQGEHS